MTRIVLLTTAIVTGFVASNSALAFGGPMDPDDRPSFSQIDTDGDGKISAEELQAYPAVRAAERFKAAEFVERRHLLLDCIGNVVLGQ